MEFLKVSRRLCYCDLDGVFTSYPKCWLEFIEARTGRRYESLDEARKALSYADYVNLKSRYRSSDFKYNLTPREGSSAFTRSLREEGWFTVLVTTRPASYPELQIRTIRWLDKNSILFDDIVFLERELAIVAIYPDFSFGVQDDPQVCNAMAKMGYKMFLMRNDCDFDELHENVIIVDSLKDIIERVSKWP
jgi:hypothetical protein